MPRLSPLEILERLGRELDSRPGPVVARFCEEFDASLRHFSEFGVALPARSVAVLTLGCGAAFGRRVGAFMRSAGCDDAAVATATRLQERVDRWMLVRVVDRGPSGPEFGLYFRRKLALPEVESLLDELDVPAAGRAALAQIAAALEADSVGVFGTYLKPGAPPRYAAYLHAWDDLPTPLGRRLTAAFEAFGLPADGGWRPFVEAIHERPLWEVRDAFVSVVVGGGVPRGSLKLDYFDVPTAPLDGALEAAGFDDGARAALSGAVSALRVERAAHMGVAFGHPTALRGTVYLSAPEEAP